MERLSTPARRTPGIEHVKRMAEEVAAAIRVKRKRPSPNAVADEIILRAGQIDPSLARRKRIHQRFFAGKIAWICHQFPRTQRHQLHPSRPLLGRTGTGHGAPPGRRGSRSTAVHVTTASDTAIDPPPTEALAWAPVQLMDLGELDGARERPPEVWLPLDSDSDEHF
jgi:hypothetical protein